MSPLLGGGDRHLGARMRSRKHDVLNSDDEKVSHPCQDLMSPSATMKVNVHTAARLHRDRTHSRDGRLACKCQ